MRAVDWQVVRAIGQPRVKASVLAYGLFLVRAGWALLNLCAAKRAVTVHVWAGSIGTWCRQGHMRPCYKGGASATALRPRARPSDLLGSDHPACGSHVLRLRKEEMQFGWPLLQVKLVDYGPGERSRDKSFGSLGIRLRYQICLRLFLTLSGRALLDPCVTGRLGGTSDGIWCQYGHVRPCTILKLPFSNRLGIGKPACESHVVRPRGSELMRLGGTQPQVSIRPYPAICSFVRVVQGRALVSIPFPIYLALKEKMTINLDRSKAGGAEPGWADLAQTISLLFHHIFGVPLSPRAGEET